MCVGRGVDVFKTDSDEGKGCCRVGELDELLSSTWICHLVNVKLSLSLSLCTGVYLSLHIIMVISTTHEVHGDNEIR